MLYYEIKNECQNGATNKSIEIVFMTNPPQQFRVPPEVMLEALNNHIHAIEKVKSMNKMISLEIPGASDDYPIIKQ